MSCPTGVLLLHALQQLKLDLRGYCMCYNSHPSQRGVAYETNVLYMSGSSSMALEAVMLITMMTSNTPTGLLFILLPLNFVHSYG